MSGTYFAILLIYLFLRYVSLVEVEWIFEMSFNLRNYVWKRIQMYTQCRFG